MTNTTNERAVVGGNNPPDPIEEIAALHENTLIEAENWSDGVKTKNTAEMDAVDGLLKGMKQAKADAIKAQEKLTQPLHKAWKAELARWKPTHADFQRLIDCLISANAPFKAKLTAEKEAIKRAEWDKANAARLEAERLAREANASDIEAQRAAQAAQQDAKDAENTARVASKDTVKGMRKVNKYEITDRRETVNFIATEFRDDMTEFIEEWVRKNHKAVDIAGVKQWIEKESF